MTNQRPDDPMADADERRAFADATTPRTFTVHGWQRRTYWCSHETEATSPLEAIAKVRAEIDKDGADFEACEGDDPMPYYMTATDEADEETEWIDRFAAVEEAAPRLRAILGKLLEWDSIMGNHDAPAWQEARDLYESTRTDAES